MSDAWPKMPQVPMAPLDPIVCGCGKGYASHYDGLCRFCREKLVRRAVAKYHGVRHSGDGMTITQYRKAVGR